MKKTNSFFAFLFNWFLLVVVAIGVLGVFAKLFS